ncbi:MAG: LPS-assembly protein LptD, partial [Treponema sp.]|nr:LPS-assembly protein LptD [Treponema sp.]
MKRALGLGRPAILFFLFAAAVYAQEAPGLSPSQNIIEMDIRTSTLSELAAWSRRNGLPEGGTAVDLARRLREHYGLPPEGGDVLREGQRIITIESARTTEYFTIQAVDEEYARLSGEVVISLREGDALHEIRAWDILFNRTRNILTASGGVEYRRTQGDTIETFRGDSITIDLDNWASVFLGGISERALEGEGITYLFAGTVISRDEEEVTVLRRATISSTGEESLWSLSATRVWLLPGSDFAIFNGVLRVGHVPVFYIPFFFFPADQMIFHPVIGSRTREGSFVNTTTWILGRPRTEGGTESSLMRIMGGGEDMVRTREGVFLRSTGRRAEPDTGPNLSLLVDFYTNLGAYIGTDLFLPGRGVLGATNLSMGVGLSRTLVNVPGIGYTPFFPSFADDFDPYIDSRSDWNHSRFFGIDLPFRYRFVADGSIGGRFGSLNWRIPFFSDPLIDSDFMDRSTHMDWLNMIQQGAAAADEQEGATRQHLRDPVWELTGQVRPAFPDMRPFITSISISPIRSSLSFRTIETRNIPATDVRAHSPMRFFFAPSVATLYSVSGSVAGTPVRLGGGGPAGIAPPDPEREDPLEGIGTPISPFAVPGDDPPPPPP